MYLLDTSACIGLMKGSVPALRTSFDKVLAEGGKIFVSSVVAFELWYAVGKSAKVEENARSLEIFFAGPVSLLSFEPEDAKVAGRIRAALESVGRPIGAYDVLIAGQALRNRFTLITANGREFARVKGLDWKDWAKG